MYKRFSGKVLKDHKKFEIFCYFMMFEHSSEIIVKVSSGLTNQPTNHDVKTFRFAERLPKPTLCCVDEIQVTSSASYGKTTPVPEYHVFYDDYLFTCNQR